MMLQVAVLSLLAASAAAMLHTAHFASAAAFAAPAAIFAVLAGLRSGDTGLFAAGLAAALLCVTGVFAVGRVIEAKAARQHSDPVLSDAISAAGGSAKFRRKTAGRAGKNRYFKLFAIHSD